MDFSQPLPREAYNYLYKCSLCEETNWFITLLPADMEHCFTRAMKTCSGSLFLLERKSKLSSRDLIDFYEETNCTPEGYYLSDIMNFSNEHLEKSHTYIQYLFPTREPSKFNQIAPSLDDETINVFRARQDLKDKVRTSLSKMIRFYGGKDWITPNNHNFLRLTRILNCLREFQMVDELNYLYSELSRIYQEHSEIIGQKTFDFWTKAFQGIEHEDS